MADFLIRIKADPTQAKQAGKEVEGSLNKASKAAQLLTRTLGAIGIAAGIAQSVRLLADFSQQMSTVQAITRATEEDMVQMTQVAKDLGATTRFSASEAAQGMIFLGRAGFDTNEVIASIDDTLRLAQAGALDLASAADIASNVLTGFRLNVGEATRVVDVLALAANSANTDVRQLGDAMKFVAPVAAGVGVELETAAAAVGALSDAGLQASLAGTGLRRVLGTLEKPTSAETEVLKELGVTTDEVRISQVGLIAALERLGEAGIDTGTALELFGDRGGPAFDVLVNSIPKIKESEAALQEAEGTAARIAETMDNNLNGALLAVKSAFEAVIIEAGELGAQSALTQFMRGLASVLRFVANNLDDVAKALTIVGVALAVNFYQRGLLIATRGVQALTAAIAANPLGALLTVVTAVTAALVLFSDEITIGTGSLTTLADVATVAFEKIESGLTQLFSTSETGFDMMEEDTQDFGGTVGLVFVTILQTAAQVVDKLVGFFLGAIGAIIFGFEKIPRALADIFFQAINGIISITEDGVNKIVAGLNKIPGVDLDLVDFNRLNNEFAGGAFELGTTVKDVFLEGFNQSVVEDAVLGVLDEADARARQRIEPGTPGAPTGVPGTPGPVETPEDRAGPVDLSFDQVLADLEREAQLLQLSAAEHERRAQILKIEDEIGRQLTETEAALVDSQLQGIQALTAQAQVLDQIQGPAQEYASRQAAIQSLFDQGRISAQEYAVALEELDRAQLALGTNLESGLARGLNTIADQINDTASIAENALVNAFNGAQDALVDFVTTGELNISGFVDNVLRDLTRLLINQAFKSLIGGALGVPLPGFATGGAFTVGGSGGTDSQTVAFRATPGERVTVQTPGQQGGQGGQAPAAVAGASVKIVNVLKQSDVAEAMKSREGEQVFLNFVTENPNTIRQVLS